MAYNDGDCAKEPTRTIDDSIDKVLDLI